MKCVLLIKHESLYLSKTSKPIQQVSNMPLGAVLHHRNLQTEAHKAKRTGEGQQLHNFEFGKMCWG